MLMNQLVYVAWYKSSSIFLVKRQPGVAETNCAVWKYMLIYASKRDYVTTRVCGIDHLNTLCGPCTLADQPNDNASLWMSRAERGAGGLILTLPATKGRIIVEVNSCLCRTPQSNLRQTIATSSPLSPSTLWTICAVDSSAVVNPPHLTCSAQST